MVRPEDDPERMRTSLADYHAHVCAQYSAQEKTHAVADCPCLFSRICACFHASVLVFTHRPPCSHVLHVCLRLRLFSLSLALPRWRAQLDSVKESYREKGMLVEVDGISGGKTHAISGEYTHAAAVACGKRRVASSDSGSGK